MATEARIHRRLLPSLFLMNHCPCSRFVSQSAVVFPPSSGVRRYAFIRTNVEGMKRSRISRE